ncbi:MAG: hypothetical protein LBU84_03055 [Prevotella sp.]|jgi:hypothetical protein|nr:hypothetical protein [Prevotella sp.]
MKLKLIFIILLFFSFSCSEEDPIEQKQDPFIQVNAFYKVGNGNDNLDINSKVFVYYGKCLWGTVDYELMDDGKFVSIDGTDTIIPEQQGSIKEKDGIRFKVLYPDKEVTIFVKSNYGKLLSGTCYPLVADSAKLTCNFKY